MFYYFLLYYVVNFCFFFFFFFFFFNDTATTEIYTLSLHDALPIFDDAEQHQPAGPAIGAELGKTIGGIVGPHRCRLPGEMQRDEDESGPDRPGETRGQRRRQPQRKGGGVEDEERRTRRRAERQGGGFDADENVVLLVLMGVDRVVAERPADAAGIEQQRRLGQGTGCRRPAEQRAPVEIEPQEELRPIGNALHEGIGRDQQQHEKAERDRQPVEAEQHGGADGELQREEDCGAAYADGAARDRPCPGAGDRGVEIAVDDVVEGAAGAAHHHSTEREEDDEAPIRPEARRRREGDRPPAGEQQQPAADRPIEPRQADIGQQRSRHEARRPIVAAYVGGVAPTLGGMTSGWRARGRRGGRRRLAGHRCGDGDERDNIPSPYPLAAARGTLLAPLSS